MSGWLSATPDILFVLALLGLPGLILALCLRFRPWDAVGFSVPLSLGVLAIADEAALHGHVRWGLPVVVGTTAVLALICFLGVRLLGNRGGRWSATPAAGTASDAVWTVREHQIAVVATLGAAVVGAIAVARGIGSPDSINQTFDGVFHVNSIDAVAKQHLASPGLFAGLTNGTHSGFYPPTFGAVAGLLKMATGINAINAANITALAMAMLWPVTVSIGIRRLARPTCFGYVIAMVGAATVALFPALLLRFGTLWPNALSYLALAPALVVLVRLFGLDESDGEAEPLGRLAVVPTIVVAVIALPGVFFAHPGAAYLLLYLAVPALVWWGWRRFAWTGSSDLRMRLVRASGVVVVAAILFVGVVWASYRVPAIAAVRKQFWPLKETWDESVGHVLLLGTRLNAPNAAMALMAVVGLFVAARYARGRLLIAWYLIIATLAVLSAGIETPSTMRWTGFWYNDPFRLFSALPVVVLPLIALGAEAIRRRLRAEWDALAASGELGSLSRLNSGIVAVLVVSLGVLALQGGLGTRRVSNTVAASYADAPNPIVNADEAAMLKRLRTQVPAGMAIAGDPYTGEVLAGVLSGHPVVYATFGHPSQADRKLVAMSFNRYQADPAVCAAVKRLKIGVVVTGDHFLMETPAQFRRYAGFENLAAIPGLTAIDSGGDATAFRVAPCHA
ncbi:MAG: DUF6541 family protein [Marmoricola sp.]